MLGAWNSELFLSPPPFFGDLYGDAPVEHAISKEEEAILWWSLEHIPQNYREPLVLFYREGQSVERVAEALELSEDAVKQRLSRGRKLLQQQVLPLWKERWNEPIRAKPPPSE